LRGVRAFGTWWRGLAFLGAAVVAVAILGRREIATKHGAPTPEADSDYAVEGNFGALDSIAMTLDESIYDALADHDVTLVLGALERVEVTAHRADPNREPESGLHDEFGGVFLFVVVEMFRGSPRARVDIPFRCLGGAYRTHPEGLYPCPRRGEKYVIAIRKDGRGERATALQQAGDENLAELRRVVAEAGTGTR
jgi:hypothetical protein